MNPPPSASTLLKEFIQSIPSDKSYRQSFVDLCDQIDIMKLHDDDFLRRENNQLKNHLEGVLEYFQKQTDNWFGEVMALAKARVESEEPKVLIDQETEDRKILILSDKENAAVKECLTNFFLHQLEAFQVKMVKASKKKTGTYLYNVGSETYDKLLVQKEKDLGKFLELFQVFKYREENRASEAAEAFDKANRDLKDRIWRLEQFLGIDEGAEPNTSDVVRVPSDLAAREVLEAAGEVHKKRTRSFPGKK